MHNLQLKQICENDKPMKKKKKKMKGLLTCLSVPNDGYNNCSTPMIHDGDESSEVTREWVQETEWNGMTTVVRLGVCWVLWWVGSARSSPI